MALSTTSLLFHTWILITLTLLCSVSSSHGKGSSGRFRSRDCDRNSYQDIYDKDCEWDDDDDDDEDDLSTQSIILIVVGVGLLIAIVLILICFCCRCCLFSNKSSGLDGRINRKPDPTLTRSREPFNIPVVEPVQYNNLRPSHYPPQGYQTESYQNPAPLGIEEYDRPPPYNSLYHATTDPQALESSI